MVKFPYNYRFHCTLDKAITHRTTHSQGISRLHEGVVKAQQKTGPASSYTCVLPDRVTSNKYIPSTVQVSPSQVLQVGATITDTMTVILAGGLTIFIVRCTSLVPVSQAWERGYPWPGTHYSLLASWTLVCSSVS